jgi:diguanylate cyclase (GGDEF)-like protein/PAS domain S-box-containing protein
MASPFGPEVYRTVLENLPVGVYLVDRERRILFWNTGAERISGYMRHEVVGRLCYNDVLSHCNEANSALCDSECPLRSTMMEGKPRVKEAFLRHKAGYRIPVRIWVCPIQDARGTPIGAAELFEERTLVQSTSEQPAGFALSGCVDPGTQLPTNACMMIFLQAGLALLAEHNLPMGVLGIRIDELEHFRATYGQLAEDAMVHVLAQTLKNMLRPADILGHWQDNRFLAIIANCDAATFEAEAERLAKMARMSAIKWWGDQLSVTVSIGGSLAQAGESLESLLQRIEELMPAAEREGRGRVRLA